jgi:quinohemoprotein ethanol dehydrogenase
MKNNSWPPIRAALMAIGVALPATVMAQPTPAPPVSVAAGASLTPEAATARYLDNSKGRDWPGYGRTFGEQHFSPLTQIDKSTVSRLGLAWSLELGPQSSFTQPIEVDGVLYFATGLSLVHAVDAVSGKLLWQYDPKAAEKAGINLRLGWGSRGIAWWNGKIYTGTEDGRLIAIDAKSGTPMWSIQTIDNDTAAYIHGAPRVFDGKVIIGYGSDTGKNRGYVTTYDAETGRQLWRFYTVPGNPADGFENKAMEMAAKTWAGQWWKFGGGGAVWNAMAYDPETNTVYIGVGGGYPGNRRVRSDDKGDNLFLASIVALDGNSGAYKWHYQETPGDTWDYESTMDIELADLTIAGQQRKVLIQAPKNGFFYVVDRITGQLISAQPYAKVNWARRIDLKTGRPVEDVAMRYGNGTTVMLSPGNGTRAWAPMAYSPQRHLAYFEMFDNVSAISDKGIDVKTWRAPTDRTVEGEAHGFMAASRKTQEDPPLSFRFIAWDPLTQKAAWEHPLNGKQFAGVMATAGDLVFKGEATGELAVAGAPLPDMTPADGTFNAYDAASGKLLWSFAAHAAVMAPPISYAVNGRQYVSVLDGSGRQARRVLAFALDGKATLPAGPAPLPMIIDDPQFRPDAARAEAGGTLFEEHCGDCHFSSDYNRMTAPDLRRSTIPLSAEAFGAVVRQGGFVSRGMPAFGEFTDEQLSSLRQYIRSEAQKARKESGAE